MTERTALLIDDDPEIYTALAAALYGLGYELIIVSAIRHVMELCSTVELAAIILNLDLAGDDGLALCRMLRSRIGWLSLPVLAMSSHSSEGDRLAGFEAGASDYLVSPVCVTELVARLQVHVSRNSELQNLGDLTCGSVQIHRKKRTVTVGGNQVPLTVTEYRLLEWLVGHPGITFSREELLASIWQGRPRTNTRLVDVCIRRIRCKLNLCSAPDLIHSVRGLGYACSGSSGAAFDSGLKPATD